MTSEFFPHSVEAFSPLSGNGSLGPVSGFGENFHASADRFFTTDATIAPAVAMDLALEERERLISELSGRPFDQLFSEIGANVPLFGQTIGPDQVPDSLALIQGAAASEFGGDTARTARREAIVDQIRGTLPADSRNRVLSLDALRDRAREIALEREAVAAEVGARARTVGSIGQITGEIGAAVIDPPNLATLFLGAGASSTILRTAIVEGLLSGGVELASQPLVQAWRQELGLEAGVEDAARNVAFATGGGAVFGGGLRALQRALERVRGSSGPSQVSDVARQAGVDQTPQGRAAVSLNEDVAAIDSLVLDGTSPAGRAEHRNRLAVADRALREGAEPPIAARPGYELFEDQVDNYLTGSGGTLERVAPEDLTVDAGRFQFKDGGDASGVLPRLKTVERWLPERAGVGVVWEATDGTRYVADGHQRRGLAERIKAADPSQDPQLSVYVFREEDGNTAEFIRAVAAAKNIAEGSGTAIDAAKVLRVHPRLSQDLPQRDGLVRTARGLMGLDDEAFGFVANEIVRPETGAVIGRLVPDDPAMQRAMMGLMAEIDPPNEFQAEQIVRQALDAGATREEQLTLLGREEFASLLWSERARIADRAMRELERDRRTFAMLTRQADRIERAGNVLNASTNKSKELTNAQARQIVDKLANRKGPISDRLNGIARRFHARKITLKAAADEFAGIVRETAGSGEFLNDARRIEPGFSAGTGGRTGDTIRDDAAGAIAEDRHLRPFDDPAGEGQAAQVEFMSGEIRSAGPNDQDSLTLFDGGRAVDLEDLEIPVATRQDDVEGRPGVTELSAETRTVSEILEEHDADAEFLAAAEICLAGGR